eukprot:6273597-Karenia_brevis.AAC.1
MRISASESCKTRSVGGRKSAAPAPQPLLLPAIAARCDGAVSHHASRAAESRACRRPDCKPFRGSLSKLRQPSEARR